MTSTLSAAPRRARELPSPGGPPDGTEVRCYDNDAEGVAAVAAGDLGGDAWTAEEVAAFAARPGTVCRVAARGGSVRAALLAELGPGGRGVAVRLLCAGPGERPEALVRELLGALPGMRRGWADALVREDDLPSQLFWRGLGFRWVKTTGEGLYVMRYAAPPRERPT